MNYFGGYTWKYEYANRTEEIRKRVSKEKREEYSKHAKKLLEYQIRHGHIDDDRLYGIPKEDKVH